VIDPEAYPSWLTRDVRAVVTKVESVLAGQSDPIGKACAIHRIFAEMGFHALLVPQDFGGRGGDHTSAGLAYELLSFELPGTLYGTLTTAHCSLMIMSGMNNDFHEDRLRMIARLGHPAAFCLTEQDAGSDISAVRTRAELEDGAYLISGSKSIAINHCIADTLVVFAAVPPARGRAALSAFVLDAAIPGVLPKAPYPEPVLSGTVMGPVVFDNARVDADCLLGEPGSGYLLFMETLDKGRPLVAACCTGEAQRAFDIVLCHVRDRSQFQKVLFDFQDISFRLAELATRLKASRLLWLDALRRIDESRPFTLEASMSKLFAAETLTQMASFSLDAVGFRCVSRDIGQSAELERIWRDAQLLKIIDGAPAVQRMVIASQI